MDGLRAADAPEMNLPFGQLYARKIIKEAAGKGDSRLRSRPLGL
jgi:hypothetical protein